MALPGLGVPQLRAASGCAASSGSGSGTVIRDSISTDATLVGRLAGCPARPRRCARRACPDARCGVPAAIASTMSCRPIPRASRAAARRVGHVLPAPPPCLRRTVPAKLFGSGSVSTPSVPWIVRSQMYCSGRLEARDEVREHARSRAASTEVVCVGVDAPEALARARPDLDRPLALARRGEARDAHDRSEQRRDRGQVVRAHVEQRPGAVDVEDVGVRVPGLLPPDEHRRADRERLADRTVVDRRAPGLVGGAEEDVGRAADAQPAALGLGGRARAPPPRRSRPASRCTRACPRPAPGRSRRRAPGQA